MKTNNTVCILIVTYNRKEYLVKLLKNLLEQTVKPDAILIFDNFSNDGTNDYLIEKGYVERIVEAEISTKIVNEVNIKYYRNVENSGGSGGFYYGMQLALKENCEYIWTMDDDVLPELNCLEKLIKGMDSNTQLCVPCRTDENYQDYAITNLNMRNPFKYSIAMRKKMIKSSDIRGEFEYVVDMPFEGPLISSELIRKIGFPEKKLFILFDDSEYAYRASKYTKIKYMKNAILHKQIIPSNIYGKSLSWKEYYCYRNLYWFDKKYGENILVRVIRPILNYVYLILRAIIKREKSDIRLINRAFRDAREGNMGKTIEPGSKF